MRVSTRRPGMNDVARAAGVSHQTVSRVLNDHPNVREETREKVLAAISELGYRRNSAARTLVTQRSGTVGVVTTGSFSFGPSQTLVAIEEAAREAGYFLTVATLRTVDAQSMRQALGHLMDQGVDGIVVIAPHAEVVDAVRASHEQLPVVVVAALADPPESVTTVSVDQVLGARTVVDHLAALGHAEVVHVSGPPGWLDAEARVHGWREQSRALGLTVPDVVEGDWTSACGYAVGRRMVAEGAPTAVFAANDHLALGLLRAFHEGGLSVPRDVSVVGFDDVTGAGDFIPPLTTVKPGFADLGHQIIATLRGLLDGAQVDDAVLVPGLVVRQSTGRPTGSG